MEKPLCIHLPQCGGCTMQQLSYEEQLSFKARLIKELFITVPDGAILPILGMDRPWHYRNKMEFSFSQNKAGERFLGLFMRKSRGKVVNLHACHLTSPWMMELLKEVRTFWEASGLNAYRMNDSGTLRTLIVREGLRSHDKLVMLTVSGNPLYKMQKKQIQDFVEAVKRSLLESQWPHLTIFLRIQQCIKGQRTQFFEMHLYGKDHIVESLDALHFKISPSSFFQPNTIQAEKLYLAALGMVSFPKKHVLDLYAGTATLGLFMARFAEKVTAIEIQVEACLDGESNKALNGLDNVEILCGDVGEQLELLEKRADFIAPDLVVIDPPRVGLDGAAIKMLTKMAPPEILYISCNPKTQAANVQELLASGYVVKKIQPVDQFPHTSHVENIVLLTRYI